MRKVRLTRAVKWRRTLGMGFAVSFYKPGDYVLGRDISEDAARHAVASNAGRYVPSAEDRETKLAGLVGDDSGVHGDRPELDRKPSTSRKKRKRASDSDQRHGVAVAGD